MHLAAPENSSLLLLTALHLANVFCRKNAENFPFHHVRSSGLGWPFPRSPVDTAGAGCGPIELLSWEPWLGGQSGAGLTKASVSHGVGEGAQPDTQVERDGAQGGLCFQSKL